MSHKKRGGLITFVRDNITFTITYITSMLRYTLAT